MVGQGQGTPGAPPSPSAQRPSPSTSTVLRGAIAGALAGACEATATCPLDTIKVRMQMRAAEANPALYPHTGPPNLDGHCSRHGIFQTGRGIVASGGLPALWTGWSALVAGVVVKKAFRFGTYEAIAARWRRPDGSLSAVGAFAGGLAAGTVETFAVVTPTELLKIRMQTAALVSNGGGTRRIGLAGTLREVIRREGPLALWTGNMPTWARQSINQGVRFLVVDVVRVRLQAADASGKQRAWHGFAAGAAAGAAAVYVSNPADVVKTRLQSRRPDAPMGAISASPATAMPRGQQSEGPLACVHRLVRTQGIMVLWSGSTARLARLVPGQMVTFGTYSLFLDVLDRKFDAPSSGNC